jgi:hypothetical protein
MLGSAICMTRASYLWEEKVSTLWAPFGPKKWTCVNSEYQKLHTTRIDRLSVRSCHVLRLFKLETTDWSIL